MHHDRSQPTATRRKMIERLARPPMIDALSFPAVRTVMAFRILALCGKAGREPLVELTRRLGSVTAAKAFLGFADTVGRCWPENVHVCRPCCRMLSPDETTLAALVQSAARGDRAGFDRVLHGFVRAERHAGLFEAALAAVGEADIGNWRRAGL